MAYKILVIDDMLVNRKLMKKILERNIEDAVFYDAENGFKALELVRQHEIDLIILDLMMPEKDGYEVLRELKEKESIRDIPVIVNSAITDMDSIKHTLELGAIDYFTKPITIEQMEVIIPLKALNALKYYEQRKKLKQVNKRIRDELKIAGALQRTLLGEIEQKNFPDLDIATYYRACDELGGDIFDIIKKGDEIWFMIGDITGHGTASAMVSFMLKAIFNYVVGEKNSPKQVIEDINKTFCSMLESIDYVCFSAIVGVIRGDKLTLSNAGHYYPFLFKANGELVTLNIPGQLAGVFEDALYDELEVPFENGESLFLYTDGLMEVDNAAKILDIEEIGVRLKQIYSKEKPLKAFIQDVCTSFQKCGEEVPQKYRDDIALMIMKKVANPLK